MKYLMILVIVILAMTYPSYSQSYTLCDDPSIPWSDSTLCITTSIGQNSAGTFSIGTRTRNGIYEVLFRRYTDSSWCTTRDPDIFSVGMRTLLLSDTSKLPPNDSSWIYYQFFPFSCVKWDLNPPCDPPPPGASLNGCGEISCCYLEWIVSNSNGFYIIYAVNQPGHGPCNTLYPDDPCFTVCQ